jgi:hypothetical protein
LASASEKVEPCCTSSAMSRSTSLSFEGFCWAISTFRLRSRGRPASMSVANWRVITTICFFLSPPM